MILLDTHVLVWLDEGNPRLGSNALKQINTAFGDSDLAVSAISFWEISMLVQKERLEIRMEMDVWRKELIESGLREIPLGGEIAIRSAVLRDFHGDPADRMIVATALQLSATLVTADKKILDWQNIGLKIDARH
ncbi:type II toxin-antitoxin system VapC family toxin [uncultured Desulfosarcina sp.]|uniref:type II toxin-antitoxin system VapC family toxin n=1 Tax=uncultured Desulfosarcina sp. TaxID=218289 RepID=UPI0029C7B412|nr:type II toxin-antitoxin system VapC family toxin [uncultured Desulfosarcina sp.]